MSVYAGASDGANTFQNYMKVQQDSLIRASQDLLPSDSAEYVRNTAKILYATQNISFANEVMGQILKNISSLQP